MASRVALVKGDDRYANIKKALELIEEDIHLEGAQRILVKPNLISGSRPLAVTHIDGLRALLDFLQERTEGQITIGEGSGTGAPGTTKLFRRWGYFELGKRYNVRFVDLNRDEAVPVEVFDFRLKPFAVRLAKTAIESDYRISIGPPKTHDTVIVTASLKNMVMGSLLRRENLVVRGILAVTRLPVVKNLREFLVRNFRGELVKLGGNDKMKMHQGPQAMNLSLYRLARIIPPHLSVLDGFEAMEGNGPSEGERVELGVAVASTDFLACDSVAVRLMGFDIGQIGYLYYCHRAGLGEGDISKVEIIGENVESCVRSFKPHESFQWQLGWPIPDVERYLE